MTASANYNSWPSEDEKKLRALWNEGLTGGQISRRFCGRYSRNAIIGKVHRMGLPLRGRDSDAKRRVKRIKEIKAEKAKPKAAVSPVTKAIASVVAMPLPVEETAPIGLKTLLELEDEDCRWFYGDPKVVKRGFCGCKTVPGTSWCAKHMISRPGSPGVYTMPSPERVKMVADVEAKVMEPAE
jgi:GcrA cell cycle regulator